MPLAETRVKSFHVDKTAAMVTSKGVHFTPDYTLNGIQSDLPFKLIRVQPDERDLTGEKFGFFTVLGKHTTGKIGGKVMWAVRCSCGKYETRRKKSIENPNNQYDRCGDCRELSFLKREEAFRRTGHNKVDHFI